MSKPEVRRFPGGPTDVVVTLTHLTEQLNAGCTNNEQEAKVTELHLNSAVLKEQSNYFEAHILRWSQTTPSAQPATPWRTTLKHIDGVGSPSYFKCFDAMYLAHYGECAQNLAQTVVTGVEDALGFLQVAANLGFSVGVDAALYAIETMPWTADEDASITECINSLQVPVPSSLAARLQKAGPKSILLSLNAVREALVECWQGSLVEWRQSVVQWPKHRTSWPDYDKERAKECLSLMLMTCNTMFMQFRKAVHFGVADKLISCFVEDNVRLVWTSITVPGLLICSEAVLLVFMRFMQALSRGEVVCSENVRQKVVCQCLDALTTIFSSESNARNHFRPGSNSEPLTLHMAEEQSGTGRAPDRELDIYLKRYRSKPDQIMPDLVCSMRLVVSTLHPQHRHSPLVHWLQCASRTNTCVELEEVLTEFMTTVDPYLPSILQLTTRNG